MGTAEDVFEKTAHPYTEKLIGWLPNVEKDKTIPDGIMGIPPNMLELKEGCHFAPRCTKKTGLCEAHEPEIRQIGEKHFVACHFAAGGDYEQ